MSETEWTDIIRTAGAKRMTSKKLASELGEYRETAVIRWGSKYRIIKVNKRMVWAPQVWIFGCKIPVELSDELLDNLPYDPGEVRVQLCGVPVVVSTWVLRSEQTIPPDGPRACKCVAKNPEAAGKWSFEKPFGSRCVVLRRRKCGRIQYRGVFWQSPSVGDTVLIQGVNIYWLLACREGEICRVTPLGCSGPYIDVHRTCLIYVSKDR